MTTIDANGETLFYTMAGDGPALVLLHAVGARGDLWADVIDTLQHQFTVYAFDLRGHGASSSNGEISVDAMAADLEAALGSLDLWPCHLVGASLGAGVAVKLAAARPDRIRSLFLSGIGLTPDAALSDEVYGITEAVHYLAEEDFAGQFGEVLLIPDAPKASIDGLRGGILAQTKQKYLAALEAMNASDLTEAATQILAPALVLYGAMDELVSRDQAAALAKALPGGDIADLEEAGQVAYLDNPAGFGAALSAFLAKATDT
jgi:pimeloyl-ACP methyl ester carboxylesterase